MLQLEGEVANEENILDLLSSVISFFSTCFLPGKFPFNFSVRFSTYTQCFFVSLLSLAFPLFSPLVMKCESTHVTQYVPLLYAFDLSFEYVPTEPSFSTALHLASILGSGSCYFSYSASKFTQLLLHFYQKNCHLIVWAFTLYTIATDISDSPTLHTDSSPAEVDFIPF